MDLSDWRREIDVIDAEVLELLRRRAAIVAKIGRAKAEKNLPIFDEERERQVLSRVISDGSLFFSTTAASRIFRCILEESRRIQARVTVDNDKNDSNSRQTSLICGGRSTGIF